MPFISSSCLFVLVKNSTSMLNNTLLKVDTTFLTLEDMLSVFFPHLEQCWM
jgi:hypothetical protein